MTILKFGILDKIPQPELESFVSKRQKWLVPLEGCTQYKVKLSRENVETGDEKE
jgi:hypothetical protein